MAFLFTLGSNYRFEESLTMIKRIKDVQNIRKTKLAFKLKATEDQ